MVTDVQCNVSRIPLKLQTMMADVLYNLFFLLRSPFCQRLQLYESQNIYFVLVGIEVWTDQERIIIDQSNSSATLENFLAYRRANINSAHDNDNAQLIT
jgi:hypothetical protein